jgi:DNA gyrase/topoisomerase IV subunit A
MTTDDEFERDRQRRQTEIRLATVDALVAALDRRAEVFNVVESSIDRYAAQIAVAALLGIPEECAESVLDRQIYHFTTTEQDQVRAEQAKLRDRLAP